MVCHNVSHDATECMHGALGLVVCLTLILMHVFHCVCMNVVFASHLTLTEMVSVMSLDRLDEALHYRSTPAM